MSRTHSYLGSSQSSSMSSPYSDEVLLLGEELLSDAKHYGNFSGKRCQKVYYITKQWWGSIFRLFYQYHHCEKEIKEINIFSKLNEINMHLIVWNFVFSLRYYLTLFLDLFFSVLLKSVTLNTSYLTRNKYLFWNYLGETIMKQIRCPWGSCDKLIFC